MPKIALLSDIHSNIHAFRSVLREIQNEAIDELAFLGDTVGYGAHPEECLRLVKAVASHSVKGNHEIWAVSVREHGPETFWDSWKEDSIARGLVHAVKCLKPEQWDWLQQLPYAAAIDEAVIVHASLDRPARWKYIDSMESAEASLNVLRGQERHVAFCGHSHQQAIFSDPRSALQVHEVGKRKFYLPLGLAVVVGVGSVGQPREPEGDLRAAWAIWDSDERIVEFRRTEYDVEKAMADNIAAGLPQETTVWLRGSVG